ncbi:MAG: hypothetical protein D6775_13010 [Caldilineae bacterium]|nr:MAG: hypothetical protein D6775_13010 [Caldilineae bacterium]
MARNQNRHRRLERTITHIQHQWGTEAIRKGSRKTRVPPHVPTGFAALDKALGIGGIPRGRITILSGAPTSGKVTLAARVLANVQKRGRPVAYVDVMHTCDADYLERCGVRLQELLVVRPENGRQALELTLALAKRSELAAILFDHWGALGKSRQERRFASGVLDHLVGRLAKTRALFLVLDDPLPLWQRLFPFADRTLAHYATLHLALSREYWLLSGPDVRGYRAQVSILKNKFGPAHKRVPIEIHFNGTVRGDGI